jgi:hypothetical protein
LLYGRADVIGLLKLTFVTVVMVVISLKEIRRNSIGDYGLLNEEELRRFEARNYIFNVYYKPYYHRSYVEAHESHDIQA